MYRLVVLNIDRTILDQNQQISEDTKVALEQLQEAGCELAIISRRTYADLKEIACKLQMDKYGGYLAGDYGSWIQDLQTKQMLYDERIPYHEIEEIMRQALAYNLNVTLSSSRVFYSLIHNEYIEEESHLFNQEIRPIVDYPDQIIGAHKIMISGEQGMLDQFAQSALLNKLALDLIPTNDHVYTLVKHGINKGNALREIMKEAFLSEEEVLVFADSEQDKKMSSCTSHIVAMKNIPNELCIRLEKAIDLIEVI